MVAGPVSRLARGASRLRLARPGRAAAIGAVALVAVVGAGSSAFASTTQAGGGGATGRVTDPLVSMKPSAAFTRFCFQPTHPAACNAAAQADIDRARKAEHLPALVLPRGFASRSAPAQLGVIVNLERGARHLATMTMSGPLDAKALAGAEAGVDPTGPPDEAWGSNYASGYATPLAADFGWMYDDGAGSPNTTCTSSSQAGCWGHRHNILSPWAGTQGAARHINSHGTVSLTQLFVERT